jgi:flagellar basal-body rod modification protein FlgD
MEINPVTRPSTSAANDASQTTGQGMSDTFMKLLVAQLKSQSPLEPLDPNQFVGQLAQFNTLGEIIRIREILDQASTATSTTNNTAAS